MRNRQLMYKKMDTLESIFTNLERLVRSQEPVEIYINNIKKGFEILEDLKSMVEAEPLSPNEVNRF